MQARDVMTEHVVTVDENTPVMEVARTLLKWRISAVPVMDSHERLTGIVSEGDLMHRPESDTGGPWSLPALAGADERAAEFAKSHGRVAKDVMTTEVVTVDEHTGLAEIARLLEEHRIKRVPVMRRSKLIGIVSRANLLHGLAVTDLPTEPAADDRQLRAAIINKLRNDVGVDLEPLNVTVSKGVAHLWGTAVSDAQRQAVRSAAEDTAGISSVEDHMNVLPEIFRQWMHEP